MDKNKQELKEELLELYNVISASFEEFTQLVRQREINPFESLPAAVIARLEDFGRAQSKLKMILDDEIFDNLSKHDPYWDHADEIASDKLYDIRMKLICLSDNLWDLWAILRREEE